VSFSNVLPGEIGLQFLSLIFKEMTFATINYFFIIPVLLDK